MSRPRKQFDAAAMRRIRKALNDDLPAKQIAAIAGTSHTYAYQLISMLGYSRMYVSAYERAQIQRQRLVRGDP